MNIKVRYFRSGCAPRGDQACADRFAVRLNSAGLPLREGAEVCSHFVRTGVCKFGPSCKFHHPEPAARRSGNGGSNESNGSSGRS